MKKNQIILVIIGILILSGLVSSFSYRLGQKSIEAKKEIVIPGFLTSRVIQGWSALALGKVTDVSGSTLILNQDNEALSIPISETAEIYLALAKEKEKKPERAKFEDIKIGDEVNVSITIKEGNIEGSTVTIFR